MADPLCQFLAGEDIRNTEAEPLVAALALTEEQVCQGLLKLQLGSVDNQLAPKCLRHTLANFSFTFRRLQRGCSRSAPCAHILTFGWRQDGAHVAAG
jgi:hypothetical protein